MHQLGKDKGWLLHDVLTPEECAAIIAVTEERKYQDANEYCYQYVRRYNDRMMCEDTGLAQFIWDRISPHLPQTIDESACSLHRVGTRPAHAAGSTRWRRHRLNDRWRFCRYYEGHYFGEHVDGTYSTSREASFWTCMVYLNAGDGKDFRGGTTDFVAHDNNPKSLTLRYRIVPKPGLCVVFRQADGDCLHLGSKLLSGTKYMMRTDVMFAPEEEAEAEQSVDIC